MINWLSWFDVDREIEIPEIITPAFAVLNNIISRGEFTRPSYRIEKCFMDVFHKTEIKIDETTGSITTKLQDDIEQFFDILWTIWHIVDTTPGCDDAEKIKLGDPNSDFEKWFLEEAITGESSFLRQLLQQQRDLNSICLKEQQKRFKAGRVDFSVESPYYFSHEIPSFFWKKNERINRRQGLVIEIDGEPFHELAAAVINDTNRDHALKLSKWKVSRVTSENKIPESNNTIETLLTTGFIKTTKMNFSIEKEKRIIFSQIGLSPIAIARIQKTLVRYLISLGEKYWSGNAFKIAVVERDVPCGYLAVDDLNEQLQNLIGLAGIENVPEFEADVYNDSEYRESHLHLNKDVKHTSELIALKEHYDLILDISVFRREGIFRDDINFHSPKTYIIRSVHFTENKNEKILFADPIIYRKIVDYKTDGTYDEFQNEKNKLTYFLRNIFRKNSFRIGQLPILSRALQLRTVIGLLPTGGGKSLTYQLASILQPGISLVVDPLRSLMIDQFENLSRAGIQNCNFINSTLDTIQRQINIRDLENGEIQFCFVSPERLVTQEFRETLTKCGDKGRYFSYCVIDEVHCVSEWGHDFRTPYLSLGRNARKYCPTFKNNKLQLPKGKGGFILPLFGLTATASFDVLADVERELEILADEIDDTIISFENTLRDEIQYSLIRTDLQLDQRPAPGTEGVWLNPHLKEKKDKEKITDVKDDWALKNAIGKRKQEEIVNILTEKYSNVRNDYFQKGVLEEILRVSFTEYLDAKQKSNYEDESDYIERKRKEIEGSSKKDGYVIFAPHRSGYWGVTDKFKKDHKGNPLPENNHLGIYDEVRKQFNAGFFVGAGDDADLKIGEAIQRESFLCLDQFINNRIEVMVATKAFGMGIDKPNIRATIHVNMPGSLESFVQESGRAGRDGKLAISFLLFNKQILKYFKSTSYRKLFSGTKSHDLHRQEVRIADYQTCISIQKLAILNGIEDDYRFSETDFDEKLSIIDDQILDNSTPVGDITNREKMKIAAEQQWADFDVLEYFHYNSFKGVKKELVVLDEILEGINSPVKKKTDQLAEEFSEETGIEIKLNWGNGLHQNNLWLNNKETGNGYGWLNTTDFTSHHFHGGGFLKEESLKIIDEFRNFILQQNNFCDCNSHEEQQELLKSEGEKKINKGLIQSINEGLTELTIEFSNLFNLVTDKKGELINDSEWLKQITIYLRNNFDKFADLNDQSIAALLKFDDGKAISILQDLWNNIEKYHQRADNTINLALLHTQEREKELARCFYCDRNSPETLKAIYRLMSIGVLTDCEIDYRTKTIKMIFSYADIPEINKYGLPGYFRFRLKEYIKRYYSEAQSGRWLSQLNIKDENDVAESIRECLRVLVEFVYQETEEKRFQSIREMVEAIEHGLPKPNESPVEGNKRFKEEIYYYFNAKYARRYVMPSGESASLVEDTKKGTFSDFEKICLKYFRVVNEDSGAYLSNLKHLRGSAQKILRAVNQNNASLRILKGFALMQLSQSQPYFIKEVMDPESGLLVTGFIETFKESEWKLSELKNAIYSFESELNRHFPEHRFLDEWKACKEMIYMKYHNWWLSKFINNINLVENA